MDDTEIVYVVDDDQHLRRSILWMLNEAGYKAEAFASGDQFLDTYDPSRRGCILLDLQMPGIDGIALQRKLIARQSPLCVIVISAYGDVDRVVSTMRGGALDFLEKPFRREVLIDRIEVGMARARRMEAEYQQLESIHARLKSLTPREQEVLALVVCGKSTKEIAYKWSISARTVEVHRSHILKKMQADSVVELTRMAMIAEVGQRMDNDAARSSGDASRSVDGRARLGVFG